MIRERTLRARQKLVSKLPITGEILRGSLLERTVRHTKDCPKCARGEGHRVFVLTVSYAGGRTRQISVRRERVPEVRRWLDNYQKLKGDDRDDLRDQPRFAASGENGGEARGEEP